MAEQNNIRKTIRIVQRVKTWQLVIVLLLMGFVAATFMRLNNVGMVQRRDAAIKAADPGDARARLYDLQKYSIGHMNADTGVFYMEGLHSRDSQAVTEAFQRANGNTTSVNAKADAVCKPLSAGYSKEYQDCMIREITRGGQVVDPLTLPKYPDAALYRYSFVSPLLTFDFAGIAVLACLVIVVIIIARAISLLVLKMLLKKRYRGI